ncbi:hypothetical protein PIB30_020617 [Stylosanthes scabra]|uniref:Uncharacterized protein n=1 Tax=Stylosanthes scabra TaxID=79078 RepID=A0ABU6S8D2_9FABA|nr:hypothetical protein [Stylosanthes scabra]
MAATASPNKETVLVSTDDEVLETPNTKLIVSSESVSTNSSDCGPLQRAAGKSGPMPATFVAGSSRSKRLHLRTITREPMAFMKNPGCGEVPSPVVGSNFVAATPSRLRSAPAKDKGPPEAPSITRTSENGTFNFKRSNKKGTPSSRCKTYESVSTGKRKLFPLNKGPPGIPPPDRSYITSSSNLVFYC